MISAGYPGFDRRDLNCFRRGPIPQPSTTVSLSLLYISVMIHLRARRDDNLRRVVESCGIGPPRSGEISQEAPGERINRAISIFENWSLTRDVLGGDGDDDALVATLRRKFD